MLEFDRLSRVSVRIKLDFLEHEATPRWAMKLSIRLHLVGLSLSGTVSIVEIFGVDRHCTTVHTWVNKANLQPADGAAPNHVALDETVIQLNDDRYWLHAAVDVETGRLIHVKLAPTRNQAMTSMFLAELRDKHQVDNAVFLVDSAPWLHAALHRHDLRFQYERHGNQNVVERICREVKLRTSQLSNTFSHVQPATAELWLQAFTVCYNAVI